MSKTMPVLCPDRVWEPQTLDCPSKLPVLLKLESSLFAVLFLLQSQIVPFFCTNCTTYPKMGFSKKKRYKGYKGMWYNSPGVLLLPRWKAICDNLHSLGD